MAIELYVFPPSPRAFKVMAVANQAGLACAIKIVDLSKGQQRDPAYAALNPNMKMPTLTDGDFVLWESNAICQYLADKSPQSGLLPADPKGRADAARWLFWESSTWDKACVPFIFENLVKPALLGQTPDAAAVEKAKEPFHQAAKILDTYLAGKKFVGSSQPTIADFALAAPLNLAAQCKIPLESHAHIVRWFKDVSALPAWQRTLAQAAPKAA